MRRTAIASVARKSSASSLPWLPIESASGRSGVSTLVTLALRVQAARCQNWRAWVAARSCVTVMRAGSAAHGVAFAGRSTSDGMLSRRKACVLGQTALEPKPSAARW